MALCITVFSLVIAMCTHLSDSSVINGNNDQNEHREKEHVQQVLSLLGLHTKQDTGPKNQSVLEFMWDVYRIPLEDSTRNISIIALGLDPEKMEESNTISATPNNVQKALTLRWKDGMTFYFEVTPGEQINGAALRIFKETSPVFKRGSFSMNLYAIKPGQGRRETTLSLESTLNVEWNTTGWLVLDATEAATNWTTSPHLNMGLYLRVVDPRGRMNLPQDIGISGSKGPANRQAFLVYYASISMESFLFRYSKFFSSVQASTKKRWTDGVEKSYITNLT